MIKRLLLFIMVLAFSVLNIKGQTDKPFKTGNFIFGGSLTASAKRIEVDFAGVEENIYYDEVFFKSNLSLGIFVSRYIVTGLKTDVRMQRTKFESGSKLDVSDVQFTPFIRGYTPIGIFGEGSLGLGSFKYIDPNSNIGDKREVYSWNLGLGYSIFINESVAIEPVISYDVRNEFREDDQINWRFQGFNVNLGIQLYIKPSK